MQLLLFGVFYNNFYLLKHTKNHLTGTTITHRTLSKKQFAQKLNVWDVKIWQKDAAFPKQQRVLHIRVLWQSLEISQVQFNL